jgi:hypothetical protein
MAAHFSSVRVQGGLSTVKVALVNLSNWPVSTTVTPALALVCCALLTPAHYAGSGCYYNPIYLCTHHQQITASMTFLPLLSEPCAFDLLVYANKEVSALTV